MQVKKNGVLLELFNDFTVSSTTLTLATAPSDDKVVAKITNTVNFIEDTANEGGSASASYVTRYVKLTNQSTAIEIRIDASVYTTSTALRHILEASGGEETRKIEDISYTAFNSTGAPI